MTDTEILIYLEKAKNMEWHLCDFFVDEREFAKDFVFLFYKKDMLEALSMYRSFDEWKDLNKIIQTDYAAVIEELNACLKQVEEITHELNIYTIAAYIDVNEYAYYCFERLVKYVNEFYFDWELNNDLEGNFYE